MNKEEVDKFCKEYYGFTLEDADGSIGYWMSKYQELEQENQHLQNNWNELKKWLKEIKESGVPVRQYYSEQVLSKMQELERGEE